MELRGAAVMPPLPRAAQQADSFFGAALCGEHRLAEYAPGARQISLPQPGVGVEIYPVLDGIVKARIFQLEIRHTRLLLAGADHAEGSPSVGGAGPFRGARAQRLRVPETLRQQGFPGYAFYDQSGGHLIGAVE